MTWRAARTAALVVAAPLVAGLVAGAAFELNRSATLFAAGRGAPAVALRHDGGARKAATVDELWERLVRNASARMPDGARALLDAERW